MAGENCGTPFLFFSYFPNCNAKGNSLTASRVCYKPFLALYARLKYQMLQPYLETHGRQEILREREREMNIWLGHSIIIDVRIGTCMYIMY